MQFNIFDKLQEEINEFYREKVHIAGTESSNELRYLTKKTGGYDFSQWETLNLIELYYNSKFDTGEYDSEGQKKIFLNISKFRADVAAKQTDIDVKDFVFVPDDYASDYGAFFLTKRFKRWAREKYFGSVINQLNQDYSKFGTCVAKRVADTIERVPLKELIVCQDAKSLKEAEYVILKHDEMTYNQMEGMEEWDLSGLKMDYDEEKCVYERYGRVPLDWYKEQKGLNKEDGDEMRSVDCLAILLPETQKKKESDGAILFLEEVKERPFEEAHWTRIDGRWLGVGEVENQFENQIARNMTANLRKRALYWSSKRIWQSRDTEIAKNLVKEVQDGDVLSIGPGGEIQPIAMESRNIGEFQSFEDMFEKNSDQKSFTYEVATGEALPSGTPFRLGVILSNSVNSHFALKRENFGIFLSKVVMEQLLEVFKKQNRREHEILFSADEKGVERIKMDMVELFTWQNFKNILLSGEIPNIEEIKTKVSEKVSKMRNVEVKIPEGFYDYLKATVDVVTTGENVNLEKKIESLTNLYNVLNGKQDPRAEVILKKILSLVGENFDDFGTGQSQTNFPGLQQAMQQAGSGQGLSSLSPMAQQSVETA